MDVSNLLLAMKWVWQHVCCLYIGVLILRCSRKDCTIVDPLVTMQQC